MQVLNKIFSKEYRVVTIAVLVLVALALGYGGLKKLGYFESRDGSAPGVEVTHADLSEGSQSKLLPGFPKDIPIEDGIILESYKVVDTNNDNHTYYSVRYESGLSTSDIWDRYLTYVRAGDYLIDVEATNPNNGSVKGLRNEGEYEVELMVSIASTEEGRSLVTVTYVIEY